MKPKVYYACPIRGHMGADATVEYMANNCQRAKKNIEILQLVYPDIEWVSVAPFDIVVQRLLAYKMVAIEDVLSVDLEIAGGAKGLLCHLWEPSAGALEELEEQRLKGKVCYVLKEDDLPEIWKTQHWERLDEFVQSVLKKNESPIQKECEG